MEEIKNEDIFNRLFDTDEKILWSGRPIVTEKKINEFTSFYIRVVVSIII